MSLFGAKRRQGLIALFAVTAGVCSAQTRSINLAQAKQVALERNWDLLSAKSGIDLATAQLIVTREYPNPTASLTTSKIGTHDAATIEGNGIWHRSYDTIAAVSQLVEIAGKRHDRQASARAGVMGARARFYDAERTLEQGVTKAYLAALLAGENVRVLQDSAGSLNREVDIGQVRFKAGDLSESDFKQIQIGAEQFELQEKSAEAAAAQARIQVEILMGVVQPKGDWEPAETLTNMDAVARPLAEAPGERPDVLAAQTDLRGGQFNLKLQKALRIPDPTFSIQYEHEPQPPGPPADDTVGIGVSFPLPLWNLNRGNIDAAKASVAQLNSALGKARTQAAADLANAHVEYREAFERLERYQTLIVPQSASSRASVAFAFEKGAATMIDLLEAERTDNTVRMGAVQARADTASAVADLIAAQTVMTETDLKSQK